MDARGIIAVKEAIHKMAHAFTDCVSAKIEIVMPIVRILVRRMTVRWTGGNCPKRFVSVHGRPSSPTGHFAANTVIV